MAENIETLVGKELDDIYWNDLGACSGLVSSPDEDIFFDLYEKDSVISKVADEVCMSCPVITQCFLYGQSEKLEGLWGGVYLNPQGRVDSAKNRHKTEEDWKLIKQAHQQGVVNE